MPSEAFISVLSARREDYNAQFLAARRAASELEEDAFKTFLIESVDPLASAVAAIDSGALFEVVDTAYAVGLELLAQRLAGPRAHGPLLDRAFRSLFPALARFVAARPNLVLPSLCNALHQLSTTPGARPDDWCASLTRLAPQIEDVERLLAVGQVAAWLAGLAHYRGGALALCRGLPEPLVRGLLGVSDPDLSAVLQRLERDPWFVPSAPELGFRFIGRVGAFRGFGGPFLEPPEVVRVGQELFVRSGADAWLLLLDAFGYTLHRVQSDELSGARADVGVAGVSVERERVSAYGKTLGLPDAGALQSVAGNASTLLLTTAHSYSVRVVALEAGP